MRCGLLGKTLGHSCSPQLHALFGDYEYALYEREEAKLAEFLRSCGLRGLNVTVPYKKTVCAYCDRLTETAAQIGSVNTLLFEDGSIIGDNTDAYGFAALLDRFDISVRGKKTLVLGSGGASKAVQYVLRGRGADVTVISRSGKDNYVNLDKHADAQLIVNATPVGMYPHNGAAPLQLTDFRACETVIDLIYNPLRTALLQQAEALGMRAVNGLYMLCAQAFRASELFQGCTLPDDLTEKAYLSMLRTLPNLILIGLPSSGKTTVGRLLAEQLGRPFYDCDAVFADRNPLPPAEFLLQFGEAEFRKRETEILKELCKLSGCIIATGGGAVTVPENNSLLHQNGTVICLERPIGQLSSEGRPLSQREGIEALAAQRQPLYAAWSDLTVSGETPQAAADSIRRELQL